MNLEDFALYGWDSPCAIPLLEKIWASTTYLHTGLTDDKPNWKISGPTFSLSSLMGRMSAGKKAKSLKCHREESDD